MLTQSESRCGGEWHVVEAVQLLRKRLRQLLRVLVVLAACLPSPPRLSPSGGSTA